VATDPVRTLPRELQEAVDAYLDRRLGERVRELVQAELQLDPARNMCRIIASKGTLDMAYPPLILASTAAALGMDTAVFFTFYGLEILKKDLRLKVDPIGNPAMPMPVPNLIAALPGMRSAATWMMSGMFQKHNVPSIAELRTVCQESGVRFIACQMTVDVMGFKPEQLIDGIEFAGAAGFLVEAGQAHTTLFI
jgi:peroxiredoxin family protein